MANPIRPTAEAKRIEGQFKVLVKGEQSPSYASWNGHNVSITSQSRLSGLGALGSFVRQKLVSRGEIELVKIVNENHVACMKLFKDPVNPRDSSVKIWKNHLTVMEQGLNILKTAYNRRGDHENANKLNTVRQLVYGDIEQLKALEMKPYLDAGEPFAIEHFVKWSINQHIAKTPSAKYDSPEDAKKAFITIDVLLGNKGADWGVAAADQLAYRTLTVKETVAICKVIKFPMGEDYVKKNYETISASIIGRLQKITREAAAGQFSRAETIQKANMASNGVNGVLITQLAGNEKNEQLEVISFLERSDNPPTDENRATAVRCLVVLETLFQGPSRKYVDDNTKILCEQLNIPYNEKDAKNIKNAIWNRAEQIRSQCKETLKAGAHPFLMETSKDAYNSRVQIRNFLKLNQPISSALITPNQLHQLCEELSFPFSEKECNDSFTDDFIRGLIADKLEGDMRACQTVITNDIKEKIKLNLDQTLTHKTREEAELTLKKIESLHPGIAKRAIYPTFTVEEIMNLNKTLDLGFTDIDIEQLREEISRILIQEIQKTVVECNNVMVEQYLYLAQTKCRKLRINLTYATPEEAKASLAQINEKILGRAFSSYTKDPITLSEFKKICHNIDLIISNATIEHFFEELQGVILPELKAIIRDCDKVLNLQATGLVTPVAVGDTRPMSRLEFNSFPPLITGLHKKKDTILDFGFTEPFLFVGDPAGHNNLIHAEYARPVWNKFQREITPRFNDAKTVGELRIKIDEAVRELASEFTDPQENFAMDSTFTLAIPVSVDGKQQLFIAHGGDSALFHRGPKGNIKMLTPENRASLYQANSMVYSLYDFSEGGSIIAVTDGVLDNKAKGDAPHALATWMEETLTEAAAQKKDPQQHTFDVSLRENKAEYNRRIEHQKERNTLELESGKSSEEKCENKLEEVRRKGEQETTDDFTVAIISMLPQEA